MRTTTTFACLVLLVSTVSSLTWTIEDRIGGPRRRGDNCAAIVNNKLYVIGGRAQRQGETVIRNQPVEIYDIATRTWTNLGDMDFEIHHGGCVAIGTDIWVVGSYFGNFPSEITHEVIHVFDTTLETWSARDYLPNHTSRRRAAGAVALHNGIIWFSHGSKGGHGRGEILSHIDEYDPATNTWNPNGLAPDGPNPRGHTAGGVVDGKMCIVGGRDDSVRGFFDAVVLQTDCFDLASRTWTVEGDIPQGRAGLGAETSCDGKLVVVGGEGDSQAYNNTDIFTPSTGWESGPDLNIPRHGVSLVSGACDCGFMYYSGGAAGQGGGPLTQETERLNPDPLPPACGGPTTTPPTSTTTLAPLSSTTSTEPSLSVDAGSPTDAESLVSGGPSFKYVAPLSIQIFGSQRPEVFRSHRFGRSGATFQYNFVVSGEQDLQLGFAEVWPPNCAAGRRVFSVYANNVLVISGLDVFSEAGCNTAHVEFLKVLPDTNGNLEISFRQDGGSRDPFISLLELSPSDGGTSTATTTVLPTTLSTSSTPAPTSTSTLSTSTTSTASSSTSPTTKSTSTSSTSITTTSSTTSSSSTTTTSTSSTNIPTTSSSTSSSSTTATPATTSLVTETTTAEPIVSFLVDAGSATDLISAVSGGLNEGYMEAGTVISGSSDPVFKSHRFGRRGASFVYTFTVAEPSTVSLGFAEIWDPNCVPGLRVFSVFVNDVRVINALDVFTVAGCNTAHTEQIDVIPDAENKVAISFRQDGGSRDPFVSSIEIST